MLLLDLRQLAVEVIYNLLVSGLLLSHRPVSNVSIIGSEQRKEYASPQQFVQSLQQVVLSQGRCWIFAIESDRSAEVQASPDRFELVHHPGRQVHRRDRRGRNGG